MWLKTVRLVIFVLRIFKIQAESIIVDIISENLLILRWYEMIFIYLMGALVALLFIKFYLHKRKIMKYVGHLPSLPEIPVVGSGLYFVGKNTIGESFVYLMCQCRSTVKWLQCSVHSYALVEWIGVIVYCI